MTTRTRYGLRRGREWLLPPAHPTIDCRGNVIPPRTTDDPLAAWAAFNIDAAIDQRSLLAKAWGITATICAISHG